MFQQNCIHWEWFQNAPVKRMSLTNYLVTRMKETQYFELFPRYKSFSGKYALYVCLIHLKSCIALMKKPYNCPHPQHWYCFCWKKWTLVFIKNKYFIILLAWNILVGWRKFKWIKERMGTRTWETTRTNSDYLWEGPARSIPTIKWLQPVRSICQTDYQGTKNARRDKGLHHGTREANKYSSSSKSTPGVIHGAPFLFQTSSY